ncbi:hypothetical protein C7C46_01970 [Streptomyces tateyamensis]|uniref:Uncharacterized protein n=1 Tax=Streptomyces tateyamensis TaxID=565073 RepID=A0A2V4P309_9ACTN|nr:hypothetical protein [Streptomyces tateyamensis]PYC87988.1 hypothetical protein C7C46_01970 [Streptomyces tateyamensis]
MSARERHFLLSRDDQDDAYAVAFRLGAVLARAGITERYGMQVQRIPGRRAEPGWGVYLVDRMADQPTPAGLSLVTTVRHTRALVAELVGLAA